MLCASASALAPAPAPAQGRCGSARDFKLTRYPAALWREPANRVPPEQSGFFRRVS